MKYFLIFILAGFTIPTSAQTIINDVNASARNVGPFSGIKASGGIDIYLSQGNDYALAVSASEDKYKDRIRTQIKDGILEIWYDDAGFRFSGNRKLRAYVSFKNIQSIEGSGACDFLINNPIQAGDIKIKLTGACEIIGSLNAENAQLNLNGASTAKIKGNFNNLKLDASGASDLKSYDLSVDNCIAYLSGASDVRLTVNKSIYVKASGASTFYFHGTPEKRETYASGASTIAQRE